MRPPVFISYSKSDGTEFAERLYTDLDTANINVWIDSKNIPPGKDWGKEIHEAVKACSVLLVVLTPGAVISDVVTSEWSKAIDIYVPVIPLLFKNCEVPIRLNIYNYIDFRSNFNDKLVELTKRLQNIYQDHLSDLERRLSDQIMAQATANKPDKFDEKVQGLRSAILSWKRRFGKELIFPVVTDTNVSLLNEIQFVKASHDVTSLAVSPDSSFLVAGLGEEKITVYEIPSLRNLYILHSNTSANTVAISPDMRYIATGHINGEITIWRFNTGNKIKTIKAYKREVEKLIFSPNSRYLVSIPMEDPTDTVIKVWETETWNELAKSEPFGDYYHSMALSPDGSLIAVSTWGGRYDVVFWSLQEQKFSYGLKDNTLKGNEIISGTEIITLAFSPDARLLATGSGVVGTPDSDYMYRARIWNLSGDNSVQVTKQFIDEVTSVAFSPDNSILVCGLSDGTVSLCSTNDMTEIIRLNAHKRRIANAIFSPDGRMLVSAGWDGNIKIWAVTDSSFVSQI